MLKKIALFSSLFVGSYGIGFAPMGNVSASLGGSGVALRNSAWGLYYNPALLSSDPRSKFAFGMGMQISRGDMTPLLELNSNSSFDDMIATFRSLGSAKTEFKTQMGVVAQMGGLLTRKAIALPDEYGRLITQSIDEQTSAFAMGAFAASQMTMQFKYYGGIDYKAATLGIALLEVPVGYAYKLKTSYGDFNFGLALKYMRASFDAMNYGGDIQGGFSFKPPDFLKINPVQNIGLDLGFLYSISDVHLGLSAKNINFPSFSLRNQRLTINPALRLGVSYEFLDNYVFLTDIDLLAQSFSDSIIQSQYWGIGIMGDYRFMDFRVGLSMDMRHIEDTKLTFGLNFFGIFDFVGEMGFIFSKIGNTGPSLPESVGVKIGSTFAF